MEKVIKNINFLDMTSATEESLEDVAIIKNVNLMIYSHQIAKLLSKISIKNVNASMEVPDHAKLRKGVFEFDKSYGTGLKEPQYLVVKGTLIFKPDVTIESLDKLNGITIHGDVLCPDQLKGAVQNKIDNQLGNLIGYMNDADLLVNELNTSNFFLESLDNHSKVVVTGKSSLITDIDPSLLQKKIEKIQFLKDVVIKEEYKVALEGKIKLSEASNVNVIPANTHYMKDDLYLDASTITRFEHAKLYVAGHIHLESDIGAELLNKSFDSLHSEEKIYCSKLLQNYVLNKCKNTSVSVIGYNGKLIIVEGDDQITQSQLKYTSGKLTYIVRGVLGIAENVDAEELYNKIDEVHLFGVITGNEEQCGVIQTKVITKQGLISSNNEMSEDFSTEPIGEENVIANMNYFKL